MKALIIVDLQNDFMQGGALEVPKANEIIPEINKLQKEFDLVVFTKDWHPENHKSFVNQHENKNVYDLVDLNGLQQVLWPVHCVENTFGSEIHKEIEVKEGAFFFTKGTDVEIDSYSGFFDNGKKKSTGLHDFLQEKGVTKISVCGLATDYCVKFTAIDAADLSYKTSLIKSATRAVNINANDFDNALAEMMDKGIDIQ